MTEPTWNDSPITEATAMIAEALCASDSSVARRVLETGNEDFLVVSYKNDFDSLWKLDDETAVSLRSWVSCGDSNKNRNLILVWDGTPLPKGEFTDGSSVVANYVTPIDWAIAFSWKIISNWSGGIQNSAPQVNKNPPKLRIFILDLESQNYPTAYACRKLPLVKAALPWLQIYRPISSTSIEIENLITAAGLVEAELLEGKTKDLQSALRATTSVGGLDARILIEDICTPTRVLSLYDAQEERNRFEDIREIVDLWQSNLTRSGERHTIGNLLAPMILVKGLPPELRDKADDKILSDRSMRSALSKLATTVGLKISEEINSPVSLQGLLKRMCDESDIFARRQDIKFLLIDDQYELGYQHILSYLLFGNLYSGSKEEVNGLYEWFFSVHGKRELRCESKPDVLFKALANARDDGKWNIPRSLKISDCDVLLLDLRLWTDSNKRKEILGKIIDLCAKLRAVPSKGQRRLFFDTAFEEAYDHANGITKGSTRHSEVEALALLPLLISYCDPSLPIVLFSSTHQRKLLELVSHRSSIITNFTKPILSEYGENDRAYVLIDNLQRALANAVHLHESRPIWE
ncbi:MAG: hypothetical protein LC768_07825, partial [Acidobacteria bacterium]|nr:hypothetical protein [Acidobacteriota bacterium]